MKEKALGVAAAAVIITSALHMSTYVRPDGVLSFLSASARDSQQKVTATEPRELSAQELYAIIKHLNNQIEDSVLSSESKTKNQGGSGSAGGSSSNMAPADTGDGSGGSPGGDSGGGSGSGSGSGSTGETSGQNYYAPISDVEAKVIGATAVATRAQNIATNVVVNKEVGQTTVPLASLLAQRKNFMMMLAKEDPRLFLVSTLSQEIKSKIPKDLQSFVEENTVLTGEIDVIHVDDFENHENSHFLYFLNINGDKRPLFLLNPPVMSSGLVFRVNGFQIGSILVADFANMDRSADSNIGLRSSVTHTSNPDRRIISDSVGNQRTLVIPIRFNDSPPNQISRENLHQRIFNGQFQNFYTEQSYGKVDFSGDVLEWSTLPGECRYVSLGDDEALDNVIISNGVDLAQYDRVVMIFNTNCFGGGFSSVGKMNVSIQDVLYRVSVAWIYTREDSFVDIQGSHPFPWSSFDFVLSHEMGHGLGVMHANGWNCGESILYGDCTHVEYGNHFDIMGSGYTATHFNAFYKELLGWIVPSKIIDITTSGRYTLNALESGVSAKQAAKIKKIDGFARPFYLELRKGLGFDSALNLPHLELNQNGLFVNRIINPDSDYGFPRLLDMNPTSLDWWDDAFQATLNTNQPVFSDPATGISIGPIVATSNESITFDVSIEDPMCVTARPIVETYHNPFHVIGSAERSEIQVSFGNGDSEACPSSDFDVMVTPSRSWPYNVSPDGPINIPSSENPVFSSIKDVGINIPSDVIPNTSLSVNILVKNLTTGYVSLPKILNLTAVLPPSISEISPLSGSVNTNVTIFGSGFNSPDQVAVYIYDDYGNNAYVVDMSLSDSSITFQFPDQVYDSCPDGQCTLIDTPPGIYYLTVYAYSYPSNTATFEVI
jgi:hypothetical protein